MAATVSLDLKRNAAVVWCRNDGITEDDFAASVAEWCRMIYVTLNSSCIDYVGYNAASRLMEVKFHRSGLYTLTGVPEVHFEGICTTDSPGGYWNEHLKGNY